MNCHVVRDLLYDSNHDMNANFIVTILDCRPHLCGCLAEFPSDFIHGNTMARFIPLTKDGHLSRLESARELLMPGLLRRIHVGIVTHNSINYNIFHYEATPKIGS